MSDTIASDQASAGSATSAFETAFRGAQEGAADAMEAAKRLIPAAGRFFDNFAYNSGYAVAYGVVFSAASSRDCSPRTTLLHTGLPTALTRPSTWYGNPRRVAWRLRHPIRSRHPRER